MKKCKVCRVQYIPRTPLQQVCSIRCATEIAILKRVSEGKKAAVIQNRELIAQKEAIKTRREWIKDVQDNAFNPYIRARDANEPCISCGRHDHQIADTYGGKWDCGHYLSVGSHFELRFEPLNSNRQCKRCNGGSGKYAKKNRTVSESYRINLIKKIGIERVEWLEGPHQPKKYTIPELIELKQLFKSKLKDLKYDI